MEKRKFCEEMSRDCELTPKEIEETLNYIIDVAEQWDIPDGMYEFSLSNPHYRFMLLREWPIG